MLKILQARFQQYVSCEIPDVKAGFRKGRENGHQIGNICWIIGKGKEFHKNTYFCFIDMPKPMTVWITANYRKFWEIGIPDHLICLLRNLMQFKKQQLELDMEQWTGSTLRKEYIKAIYCHCAYLIICRIHHAKCQIGWSTSWNQDCRRNINNLRYADDTTLMGESKEELRASWWKWKRRVEKLA